MGNSGLKQHYETASKTGVLTITEQKLKELPPAVLSLQEKLRNLDLSHNRFQELPDSIGGFKILKQLLLNHNKLQSLPDSISLLVKLEILNVSNNYLEKIPVSLNRLVNLKQVYMNNNRLAEFPKQLIGLKQLDVVELSHNKIMAIPSGMAEFYATELNMNQNQVSVIADDLANAPKLKILRLEENCLTLDAIKPSLLRDSKLHTLVLDGNLFESKQLMCLEGYNEYMERYTAMKKKMF